jgi:DNA-binding NarL/FixJ family response regulator
MLPFCKNYLEGMGFTNVYTTSEEKKELTRLIRELKPRIVFIESCFYNASTPYMLGRLLREIPKLNICAFSIGEFPDDLAVWFYFHGVKSYINFRDGIETAVSALEQIKTGNGFFPPPVRELIDCFSEWPKIVFDMSDRQKEVLFCLCLGFKLKEIEKDLDIGQRTVEWHLKCLYEIFHVHSKGALATAAWCLDLFTKKDACFYGKKLKKTVLPQWAVIKQTCSRRGI